MSILYNDLFVKIMKISRNILETLLSITHFSLYYSQNMPAIRVLQISPDTAVCLCVAAGWIRKEEYGYSNEFFRLDTQNSFIEPRLKTILGYMCRWLCTMLY